MEPRTIGPVKPEVLNPFDKKSLLRWREEFLRCVSFWCRLVNVEKATTKGSIRNVEIESSLFDIYFKAIALLAEKAAATLFEYSSVSICDLGMHESRSQFLAEPE